MDCQRSLLVFAFFLYFFTPIYGFMGATSLATCYSAFKGAHHLLYHYGTLLFMVALAFPYTSLTNMSKVFVTLAVSYTAVANFLAYATIAATGEGNEILAGHKGGQWKDLPLGDSSPVSQALLMSCSVSIPAMLLLVFGLACSKRKPKSD